MKRGLAFSIMLSIAAMSAQADPIAQKAQSMVILDAQGIPVLDSLPVIESEAEALRRSEQEVAERAIALLIIAVLGETGDRDLVARVIPQYDAQAFFTRAELALLETPSPSDQQLIDATWRYEAAYTLLWALGFYEVMQPADRIVDVNQMASLVRELGTNGLLQDARLRPQSELLDAADLIYRTHWAVRQARLNGQKPPASLLPGVVYERHYALNWLIGYLGQDWDDITTDT